jgi:hypothetical protein
MTTTYDVTLHNFIKDYNVLESATNAIKEFFEEHTFLHKVALVVSHVFRALAMTGLCLYLPFSAPVNMGICFAGSLFYRLTVETHCPFKFALPAFAGSLSIPLGVQAIRDLINGIAFTSIATFSTALVSIIPLFAYSSYVLLTVNYDVNNQICECGDYD